MNIFLDTLSPKNILILFDDNKNILQKYLFDVRLNESTKLIEEFDNFLKQNNLNYNDLKNIIVVNGPGSFTGIRTTILLVNTINFIIKGNITTLTYFDLFENYPIIKTSSKRDSFLKLEKDSAIEVVENTKLNDLFKTKNIKQIYSDINLIDGINIISEPNYEYIIKNLQFKENKIVEPFYFKKPNIC
ncbi:MAG: hypothetical protein PHE25_04635 [Candidatus Gracilibacteria bacterium]|nr:hypothetical protein [Candidatus Gracilibacteria bacterium]